MPQANPLGVVPSLGDLLADQVADETDEERRKRLAEQQRQQGLGGTTPLSSVMGSMTKAGALSSIYSGGF